MSRVPRPSIVAAIAGLSVVLAACSSSDERRDARPDQDRRFSDSDVREAKPLKVGRDYEIRGSLDRQYLGEDTRGLWLTTAGPSLVFGLSTTKADGADEAQDHVLMSSLTTGTTEILADRLERPEETHFQGMDGAPGWLAWAETTSVDSGWNMYSYDARTERVRLIAKAPMRWDGAAPSPVKPTVPTISGDTVFFSAVTGMNGEQPETSVFSVPVDGSSPMKVIAKESSDPSAADGRLAYVRGEEIVVQDLTTDAVDVVAAYPKGRGSCGWAYNEGTLATCTRVIDKATGKGSSTFHVVDPQGHKATIGPLPATVPLIRVSSRWVAFTRSSNGGSEVFIYDIAKEALRSAGNLFTVPEGNGSEMIWHTLPAKGQSILASELVRLK